MKQAVLYLRVSTSAQADKDHDPEGYSIPAQCEACLNKAAQLEALVVDEYVDRGESAKSTDRPALKTMLQRIEEGRDVDLVIVHKVDRLARNRYDDVTINLTIRRAGAELVSVSEHIDDTPSGQLLHAIMAAHAEFYSRNLATESLKGLVQKAKSGGTPTRAPLGYLHIREHVGGREIRTVAVDPERAELVRWAFEAYASGEYTLEVLLDELTAKGLRSRETAKRPPQPITRGALAKMLHNPYYIGKVRYRGMEYEGRHPRLISPELFGRVQRMFKAHDRAKERDRKHPHYLKGSLFCRKCGSRLVLTHAKGTYLYFFCSGPQRRNGCAQRYVLAEDVEQEVCRYYSRVQLTPEEVNATRPYVLKKLERDRRRCEQDARRAKRRVKALHDERAKLLRAHYAGAVPLELLKDEQVRIAREIGQAEEIIASVEMEFESLARTVEQAFEIAGNCARAYEEAPAHVRRLLNQQLFKRLLVEDEGVADAEPGEVIPGLLDRRYVIRQAREASNPDPLFDGRGSNKAIEVRAGELELVGGLSRREERPRNVP
jgi:site-specific DNA recombinase